MKRKSLLLILFGLAISGCANINYTSPSGESFSYTRLGSLKLDGFEMAKTENGLTSVAFEKLEGDAGVLAESVNNISQLMLRMAGAYVGMPVPPIQPQPMPTPQPTLQPTPTPGN